MRSILITPPPTEPVTLAEVKAHLRVETGFVDDDTYLTTLITVARRHVEEYTRRALITQTWEVVLDAWPYAGPIELSRGPLQTVSSVKYIDGLGTQQTFSSSYYTVDTAAEPGLVWLGYGATWPTIRDIENAVRIRYVAGYGLAAAVPAEIKHAILILIAHLYEQREMEVIGASVMPVAFSFEALLSPHRLVQL